MPIPMLDDFAVFPVFLFAALMLAVTPGPGLAYVVARTVAGGRSEGIASSIGTAIGGLGHVLAAALGLSALVAQSAVLFGVVKYLGACYLIYLGLRLLLSPAASGAKPALKATGRWGAFREGIVVEVLNVKTALFFLAFIPQFIDGAAAPVAQFIVLGSVCVLLNTTADFLAVFLASRLLRTAASRRLRTRLMAATSGVTLVALGMYVALARQER